VTSCRTTVIEAFQDVRVPCASSAASVRLSECDAVAGSKEPRAVCQPGVAEGGVDLGRAFAISFLRGLGFIPRVLPALPGPIQLGVSVSPSCHHPDVSRGCLSFGDANGVAGGARGCVVPQPTSPSESCPAC
jgi:hypothetical protein